MIPVIGITIKLKSVNLFPRVQASYVLEYFQFYVRFLLAFNSCFTSNLNNLAT